MKRDGVKRGKRYQKFTPDGKGQTGFDGGHDHKVPRHSKKHRG